MPLPLLGAHSQVISCYVLSLFITSSKYKIFKLITWVCHSVYYPSNGSHLTEHRLWQMKEKFNLIFLTKIFWWNWLTFFLLLSAPFDFSNCLEFALFKNCYFIFLTFFFTYFKFQAYFAVVTFPLFKTLSK
jgi:hypothetical protein